MKKRNYPEKEVMQWNQRVKVGDTVEYREVIALDSPKRFTTRTPAQVYGGHTAVVWLNGKVGFVVLSHCQQVRP